MGLDFENPFSDYGGIVHGERFIGRHEKLKVIERRVIRPQEAGNLAIIGNYRIGKSSLVYQAVMECRKELLNKRLLPIWINLATYDQASIFFRSLVTCSYDDLGELGWLTEQTISAAKKVLEDESSWSEGYGRIQRYFEKIHQTGIHILFILDEFDHARNLFKGDVSGFQGLRELSYWPEWRVNYITISRRSLQDIEIQTKAISTLDGIFQRDYLGMFNESDILEYLALLSSVGIEVTLEQKERLGFYCGGHPYLLEMFGYEIVEQFREEQVISVDKAAHRVEQSLIDYYEHIFRILSEDDSIKKLLQILFGPIVDAKQTDAEEFERYGLIQSTEHESYEAFSGHFQTYLKMMERQIDIWPLWRETEIVLRDIVTAKMQDKYGEQWITELIKSKPNLKEIFKKCQEAQRKEIKSFGSQASKNVIDFTYPQDLFAIIFAEWGVFGVIFGKDKNYWDQRSRLLSKVRNPLAHNRNKSLSDYEQLTAEAYCKEILTTLRTI